MNESDYVSPASSPPESEVSRTLRNRCSSRGRSSKFRTPRTLTRQLQQHRDNERDRHRGLNASILEISKRIPGHNQLPKETKIVRLQRLINYICHLETHIQSLCLDLDIDLEFKNLFLTPHISEDTKRALARQTGYDPDAVKVYGDAGTMYIVHDTMETAGSDKSPETGVDYQVTLPCRNMYYCPADVNKPSNSWAKRDDSKVNFGIQRRLAEHPRKASVRKRRRNKAKKSLPKTKGEVEQSSETSDKETSDNEEQSEQQDSGFKPKYNWLDDVTLKEKASTNETNTSPVFPQHKPQAVCGTSSESSESPDYSTALERRSKCSCSSAEGRRSPCVPHHTPATNSKVLRATPTLTASQANEGQTLFHSYARAKPGRVQTPGGSKDKVSAESNKEGCPLSSPHKASSEESEINYSEKESDDVTSLSKSSRKTEVATEINVVEMEDSDEGENCSHSDPFLSSTVLSSVVVRGAQEALKSCLHKNAGKQRVYGERKAADSVQHPLNALKENVVKETRNTMNENLPNNTSISIIDKTPPKLLQGTVNKRKNYTPNKISKSDMVVRSPLSPISGNVHHLTDEDKPLFEISPGVMLSPSPAFGGTFLKGLLGFEEDPLYPHLETSDHADLKHHVTSPRSQGGLLSQDSGLQSQDSGFVNSMG